MQYWYMIYHELHSFYFLFPKCARGKECESIVIHIQHFVFKDCALKSFKIEQQIWLFMVILQNASASNLQTFIACQHMFILMGCR